MDDVDRAQEREQLDRDLALNALRRRPVPPTYAGNECVDCGDTIDPRRRAAVPTATRCAECQQRWETYGV